MVPMECGNSPQKKNMVSFRGCLVWTGDGTDIDVETKWFPSEIYLHVVASPHLYTFVNRRLTNIQKIHIEKLSIMVYQYLSRIWRTSILTPGTIATKKRNNIDYNLYIVKNHIHIYIETYIVYNMVRTLMFLSPPFSSPGRWHPQLFRKAGHVGLWHIYATWAPRLR